MIKKIIKYFLYFLILIFIGILYLSYFGVETKKFNQLIKNEVSKVNKKISIELKDVKILLNLSNFSIALKTYEPNLVFDNKKIKLKNIKTNFSLGSFLKKEFAIKNVSLESWGCRGGRCLFFLFVSFFISLIAPDLLFPKCSTI